MAGFTLRAELSYLDPKDLDTTVNAFVKAEMVRGIREFLKACLVRIPVRTGFLRGSFTNIAREFDYEDAEQLPSVLDTIFSHPGVISHHETLSRAESASLEQHARQTKLRFRGRLRNLVSISPQQSIHSGGGVKGEYYYDGGSKILKTPTSGIPFATPPQEVLIIRNGVATFKLKVNISYYAVNDFSSRIRGAPWGSLDAGAAAMVSYLEQAASRFPKLTSIMGKTIIELSGRTVIRRREFPTGISGVL